MNHDVNLAISFQNSSFVFRYSFIAIIGITFFW